MKMMLDYWLIFFAWSGKSRVCMSLIRLCFTFKVNLCDYVYVSVCRYLCVSHCAELCVYVCMYVYVCACVCMWLSVCWPYQICNKLWHLGHLRCTISELIRMDVGHLEIILDQFLWVLTIAQINPRFVGPDSNGFFLIRFFLYVTDVIKNKRGI